MRFTVFTAAGGLREFSAGSQYDVGEGNGVLHVRDGASGQVIAYGPQGWASVQEWVEDARADSSSEVGTHAGPDAAAPSGDTSPPEPSDDAAQAVSETAQPAADRSTGPQRDSEPRRTAPDGPGRGRRRA